MNQSELFEKLKRWDCYSTLKTDNVIFYSQGPLEEMPILYKIADAMIVTLEHKPYANMTIPGKVQQIFFISGLMSALEHIKDQLLISSGYIFIAYSLIV